MVSSSISARRSILTIHLGFRDVHIHNPLVKPLLHKYFFSKMDDDNLMTDDGWRDGWMGGWMMMDGGLDEQIDLKEDGHVPA